MAFKQTILSDDLIKEMIDKVVYNSKKLMIFINLADTSYLTNFKENEINPANEPMSGYYISDDNKHIILEKTIFINQMGSNSNRYIGQGISILTKSENANNLIRALAYGWRYKKLYEKGTAVQDIEKQEKVSHRTIYKYLSLGYLSPKIINTIMNSTIPPHINLQNLLASLRNMIPLKNKKERFGASTKLLDEYC